MRIIGGEYKRRRLMPLPRGASARPVPDPVREAVFNLMRGHVEGERVLDLFSGTGAVGLEAASRGASHVVCVERDPATARVLGLNAASLGCEDRVEVVCADALGAAPITRCARGVHLVFVDPPYEMVRDPESWGRVRTQFSRVVGLLDATGYAMIRTPWPFVHERVAGEGGVVRSRVDLAMDAALGPETHAYGTTAVHLYMRAGGRAASGSPGGT